MSFENCIVVSDNRLKIVFFSLYSKFETHTHIYCFFKVFICFKEKLIFSFSLFTNFNFVLVNVYFPTTNYFLNMNNE